MIRSKPATPLISDRYACYTTPNQLRYLSVVGSGDVLLKIRDKIVHGPVNI